MCTLYTRKGYYKISQRWIPSGTVNFYRGIIQKTQNVFPIQKNTRTASITRGIQRKHISRCRVLSKQSNYMILSWVFHKNYFYGHPMCLSQEFVGILLCYNTVRYTDTFLVVLYFVCFVNYTIFRKSNLQERSFILDTICIFKKQTTCCVIRVFQFISSRLYPFVNETPCINNWTETNVLHYKLKSICVN